MNIDIKIWYYVKSRKTTKKKKKSEKREKQTKHDLIK